jgi:hypothetical protein
MAKIIRVEPLSPVSQINYRTAGVAVGLNAFRETTSPSRLYMLGKNQGKAVVIHHPTNRKCMTGDEMEYAKTARKVEASSDIEIEQVFFVPDILNTSEPNDWGCYYAVGKNLETGSYDLLEMPRFNTQNMDVGFQYRYNNDLLRSVTPGARFRRGTVFASSSRISESNEWCPGLETRVALMSHRDTEEDAVVISDLYAERIGVTFSRSHEHQWNEDEWIPLDLYGEEDGFPQPFPLNGQSVREDGIVMGFRRKDANAAMGGLTREALRKPDPLYDVLFYSSPGCVVSDIEVQTERYKNQANNRRAEKITQPYTMILEKIEEAHNTMYNNVVKWFNMKRRQYDGNVPVSHALWNFILNAEANITKDYSTPMANGKFRRVKRKIQNINLKDWRVVIKLKESVTGKVRFKNTGMDGNKSVIMRVIPWQNMPVDDHGNRAEMIAGNTPAFRRQILGSLIEQDVNFINIHLWKDVVTLKEAGDYAKAWDAVWHFYDAVNPEFGALMTTLDADERIDHIDWVCRDENEFAVQTGSQEVVGIKIAERLEERYPNIQPTPVTFINDSGETKRTRYPVVISSLYYVMLDKFGDDMSCQSMPKLNVFGLPTSLSKHERARDFYRATLNRNVGETEGRLYINQKGGAAAVRALAMANGEELILAGVRRILRADNPFLIHHLVRPGEERNNHSLQVINNIMGDYGIGLRKENENDRIA